MSNDSMDITQMVLQARSDFEAGKIDEETLKQLYQEYNPIEDIDSFVKKARGMFPKLNCGLTSVYLRKIIGDGRIVNGTFGTQNHTFLLLNESIVIDITSDQYGGPRVYMDSIQKPWSTSKC